MLHRKLVILAVLLGGLVFLGRNPGTSQPAAGQKLVLKVIVPQEDADVSIDGKLVKGSGKNRKIETKLAEGKDSLLVKAVYKPNNYTEITRKKNLKVAAGDMNLTVDLRKVDPKDEDIKVIFVPTPEDVVEGMCKMAKIGKNDVVYDLGCGDGRMVIMAVKKFGAKRGVGIDLDPKLVKECKDSAKTAGVDDKVAFRVGDVLKVKDLSDATVVLLYMGDDINNRLKPILKATLKPGARVVSHRFLMGDDWKPGKTEKIDSSAGYECVIHLWVIKEAKKKD